MVFSFISQISNSISAYTKGPIRSVIGAILNKEVVNTKNIKPTIGPRIADVTLQTASYGRMIPIVYGTIKLAGNVIWASEISEHRHDQYRRTGKFRGKSLISSSFSYSISLAIAICEGEVDEILRVWADDQLMDPKKWNYRFYLGSEDQMPDHLMEASQGIGNTPAYRGLCYVVIENLALHNFGNRVPNFVFEVKRIVKAKNTTGENPLEERIKSMVIIPGSGEFVYDTKVQTKVLSNYANYGERYNIEKSRINQNNREGEADALLSLKQLNETCPNLEWVAPVVNWFTSSLDARSCKVLPGVEYNNSTTSPDVWSVGGFTRQSAHQILKNKFSSPIYGGTPNDISILRYLDELKSYGYKIMFYPMLLVDKYEKPWRGKITGVPEDVESFFNQYNKFILHYARLVKDRVDAFLIGSEMIGLTKIKDKHNNFPAVDALINLAKEVKNILGNTVKISYAADWSEYHHCEGGWYNLDKLWASDFIDFVGIDAYFPLTNLQSSFYEEEPIINGWKSGEGYDYYYEDPERLIKKDLSKEYAWKNIEYWWSNEHFNPDGNKTAWKPKQKKIWFTEIGFPSVDLASNQPNVFYSPDSIDSSFPIHSKGKVDFVAQRQALSATEKVWRNSEIVEQLFIWTWDARPFPYWPDLLHIWRDGNCWMRGHWVNGKLGLTKLEAVIQDLAARVGIDAKQIRAEELYDYVDGMVLFNQEPVNEIINILKTSYFFETHEDNNFIYFKKKYKVRESILVDHRDIVICDENKKFSIESFLPSLSDKLETVCVHFLNKYKDYLYDIEFSYENISSSSQSSININLPLVLTSEKAKNIADVTLYEKIKNKNNYNYIFTLPSKYLQLLPNDLLIISNTDNNMYLHVQEIRIEDCRIITVVAVEYTKNIYIDAYSTLNQESGSLLLSNEHFDPGTTEVLIINLPKLPFENFISLYIGVFSDDPHWRGALVECPDGGDLVFESKVNIGIILKDNDSILEVQMIKGELFNFAQDEINPYQNLACIGDEVIQFKNIKQESDNVYFLNDVIREMFGSKKSNSNKFILLDKNLKKMQISNELKNSTLKFRVTSIGQNINDYTEIKYEYF